jgi:short-subunit dehydrogenase
MAIDPSGDSRVCIITGVGPGTGTALVERFASDGYRVAMLSRDGDRLSALEQRVSGTRAFSCDVTDTFALTEAIASINNELGTPTVVVHNAVGGVFGSFLEIEPEDMEKNFQINTMALLHLARLTVPGMIAAGGGALLATGNTSAYRGKANFAGFAPTKAAQRILLESIARHSGPEGVHAAYIRYRRSNRPGMDARVCAG